MEEVKNKELATKVVILPSNKKPFIPLLKVPEKGEQPEGKEKIKQQIEF